MGCQESQDNVHILTCGKTNHNKNNLKYEDQLNGSLNLKMKAFKIFQEEQIENICLKYIVGIKGISSRRE